MFDRIAKLLRIHKSGSLYYRNNWRDIWKGNVPDRYRRILPYVTGHSVLEVGSAEGITALLLAESGKSVYGLEKKEKRHAEALRLKSHWNSMGRQVSSCTMINADLRDRLDLLGKVDTLLAIRSIYYLGEDLLPLFEKIGKVVPNVVLCGNITRAKEVASGKTDTKHSLGRYDYYATVEGMSELLSGAGYEVVEVVHRGDPIVVGRRKVK